MNHIERRAHIFHQPLRINVSTMVYFDVDEFLIS